MPSSARWLALLTGLLAFSVGSAHAQCGPRFVAAMGASDTGNNCLNQASPCATIQHAVEEVVTAVCSAATVNVDAGTYIEQITIAPPAPLTLTLTGAGAANTTISAPSSLTGNLDIVTIGTGATVELSGFTVSGPANPIGAGIDVLAGGSANIHDNTIADVRHNPLDGAQEGNGIAVGSAPSGAAMATIVNNTIVRYQKRGIRVQGAGSTAMVTGNTVTGVGATPAIAQNGIVVSSGASATVTDNTVSGNECNEATCGPDPLTDFQAIGILLNPAAAGTTVTGNSVAANDIGIYNFAEGATTLSANTLTDNRFVGIVLEEGDATVDSNKIDPGNIGILAVSFAVSAADSKGTLTCNEVTAATQAGIRLLVEDGSDFMTVVTATNNSITGNVGAGLDNETTSSVDARQNWWGCPQGPNNTGCDTVTGPGPVDFSSPLPGPPPCVSPTTTSTTATTMSTTTTTPISPTTTTLPPQCLSDASCGDGNICNGVETCQAGVCIAGTPLDCDDGDPCTSDSCESRAGCQHTTVADLGSCSIVIPGGKNRKSDCYVFADVQGMHPLENGKTLKCSDGDPTCDMDGKCDNVCTLEVRLCINSATLSPCTPPSQLTTLKFKSHPASFALNTPAQLTGPQCGAFRNIKLPVKLSKKGKKSTGVLKVTATAKAPSGTKPKTDSDTYVMKCAPGCAR